MSQDFNYQEALLQCKTMEDITGKNGLVQKIIKDSPCCCACFMAAG